MNPLVLAIDTATLTGSVCITRGSSLLTTRIGDPSLSHSNSLLKDINESLSGAQVSLSDVDLIAAASGPGSFTGLRIGLATVKALAATLRIRCVGVPTLYAVAHAAGPANAIVALLPAGRGELFSQLLLVSPDGRVTPLDDPAHLSPQRVVEKYSPLKALKWYGPGAHLYRDLIEAYAREMRIDIDDESQPKTALFQGWRFASTQENLGPHVAALGLQKFESGDVGDPISLSAIYVRPSDAELKCP